VQRHDRRSARAGSGSAGRLDGDRGWPRKPPISRLPDQSGTKIKLSDYRIVRRSNPFTFTGVCTGELCELVTIWAATSDPGRGDSWRLSGSPRDEQLHVPCLSDFWPHGEVSRLWVFNDQVGAAMRGTFRDRQGRKGGRRLCLSGSGTPRAKSLYEEALASWLTRTEVRAVWEHGGCAARLPALVCGAALLGAQFSDGPAARPTTHFADQWALTAQLRRRGPRRPAPAFASESSTPASMSSMRTGVQGGPAQAASGPTTSRGRAPVPLRTTRVMDACERHRRRGDRQRQGHRPGVAPQAQLVVRKALSSSGSGNLNGRQRPASSGR